MVEANTHRKIAHDQCPTCKQRFVGALSMALAEARVRETRESRSDINCEAVSELAQACLEQGHYDEADDAEMMIDECMMPDDECGMCMHVCLLDVCGLQGQFAMRPLSK
jgi:hypothetical protein